PYLRREVRRLRRERRAGSVSDRRVRATAVTDQRRQCDRADPRLAALEELPARAQLCDLLPNAQHRHPFVNTPSRFSSTFATTVPPPSWTIRRARACDASTYTGSLSVTNACRGVFVRMRRARQNSRLGASKVAIEG